MPGNQIDSGATTTMPSCGRSPTRSEGRWTPAEYKHVVLGLIFLKHIPDAFERRHAVVLANWGEEAAEDRDEYIAENIFWVPPEARWTRLRAETRQPTVGQTVDRVMSSCLIATSGSNPKRMMAGRSRRR